MGKNMPDIATSTQEGRDKLGEEITPNTFRILDEQDKLLREVEGMLEEMEGILSKIREDYVTEDEPESTQDQTNGTLVGRMSHKTMNIERVRQRLSRALNTLQETF